MRIVLATGNRDKVAELSEMFPGVDVGAAPDGFDVEETGVTLLQNAWIKAAAPTSTPGNISLSSVTLSRLPLARTILTRPPPRSGPS